MARNRSPSCSLAAVALLAAAAMAPPAAAGQAAGSDPCAALDGATAAECRLAVAAARTLHERVGTALWGGNPVPGTASTLGMRIGTAPRFTVSGGLGFVPLALPPLLDRSGNSPSGVMPVLSARAAMAVLPGWSPLPTVGGVLSLDLIAGGSLTVLPDRFGFDQRAVVGWLGAARLGLLRESFTLPGVSVTGSYGRSAQVTLGDPAGSATDGHFDGSLSDLGASVAVTRRISALRLTGGAAFDRYMSADARIGFPGGTLDYREGGRLTSDRWSAYGNAAWTVLIFHTSLEVGWQEAAVPAGLPAGVAYDPARWWAGIDFRISL